MGCLLQVNTPLIELFTRLFMNKLFTRATCGSQSLCVFFFCLFFSGCNKMAKLHDVSRPAL